MPGGCGMPMKPIPEETLCGATLLPAKAAFTLDDSASAASSMEVTDRIASLEQRVQMQEDEIQLLKSALADVVRRLNVSEEQQAMVNRKGPTKARPLIPALPLRPTVNNGTVLPKKPSTLPSPSNSRKDAAAPATKSTVKRTSSTERMSTLTRKESIGDAKSSRTRAGSTGSNSSGKRTSESKPKEPVFSAGMRRVTHCTVTMQIYLDHPANRTRSSEAPESHAVPLPAPALTASPESDGTPHPGLFTASALILPFRTPPAQPPSTPLGAPAHKSPIKSPNQYLQICY